MIVNVVAVFIVACVVRRGEPRVTKCSKILQNRLSQIFISIWNLVI